MGLSKQEIGQPFVGVVTTWNEAVPCNITLARQAQAAKRGVVAAGGAPREFTTITVTDGIAMGHAGMKASLGCVDEFDQAKSCSETIQALGLPAAVISRGNKLLVANDLFSCGL